MIIVVSGISFTFSDLDLLARGSGLGVLGRRRVSALGEFVSEDPGSLRLGHGASDGGVRDRVRVTVSVGLVFLKELVQLVDDVVGDGHVV